MMFLIKLIFSLLKKLNYIIPNIKECICTNDLCWYFQLWKSYLIQNWFVQVENKYDFFNLLTVYGYIFHFHE